MNTCKQLFLRRAPALLFIIVVVGGAGCTLSKMTNPKRSATEQLLLSTATDHALHSASFAEFAKQKVFLDASFFDSYDAKYVVGSIRDALSRAGALLMDSPTNSDIIIEARSGALSIDEVESLVGIPNAAVPVPLAGAVTLPEVALYKSQKQASIAKIALLAYARDSRAHVYSSGPLVGRSFNHYYKFLFAISWATTDIPERQPTPQLEARQQTWRPQYDALPTNAPAARPAPTPISTPVTHLPSGGAPATNPPSASVPTPDQPPPTSGSGTKPTEP